MIEFPARFLSLMAEEQLGIGKSTGEEFPDLKESPPQLEQILPLLLGSVDSRTWCTCVTVSHAAHDAVRALFSGLIPDGPRPDEGWTGAMQRYLVGDRRARARRLWLSALNHSRTYLALYLHHRCVMNVRARRERQRKENNERAQCTPPST